jgi:hypothetical protein
LLLSVTNHTVLQAMTTCLASGQDRMEIIIDTDIMVVQADMATIAHMGMVMEVQAGEKPKDIERK